MGFLIHLTILTMGQPHLPSLSPFALFWPAPETVIILAYYHHLPFSLHIPFSGYKPYSLHYTLPSG